MSYHRAIFILLLTGIFAVSVFAVPREMQYQGKLTDATGVGINDTLPFVFRIYDDPTAGVLLWTETHPDPPGVPIVKGLFDVVLGSISPINLPFGADLWLEIEVDGAVLTPRVKLLSSPYSFRAAIADSVAGGIVDNDWARNVNYLYPMSPGDSVGIGTATPSEKLEVVGNAIIDGNLTVTQEIDPIAVTFVPIPASPPIAEGKVYYNNADNELYVYDGAVWQPLIGGGGAGQWTDHATDPYIFANNNANIQAFDTGEETSLIVNNFGGFVGTAIRGLGDYGPADSCIGYLGYGGDPAGHPEGWGGAGVYGYTEYYVDAVYGYARDGGNGVLGVADGMEDFAGVRGYHNNTGTSGRLGTQDYGGDFDPGIMLVPGTAPAAAEGAVYADATAHNLYYYDGTSWVDLTAVGAGVGGSGTLNYVPLWTPDGSTLGDSRLQQNATTVFVYDDPTNPTVFSAYPDPVSSSHQFGIVGSNLFGDATDGTDWNWGGIGGAGVCGINETAAKFRAGLYGLNWSVAETTGAVVGAFQSAPLTFGALAYRNDGSDYAGWFNGDVYIAGNAGIGVTDPTFELTVANGTNGGRIMVGNTDFNFANSGIIAFNEDYGDVDICGYAFVHDGDNNRLDLTEGCSTWPHTDTVLTVTRTGPRVGIHNASPSYPLDITGDTYIDGDLTITGNLDGYLKLEATNDVTSETNWNSTGNINTVDFEGNTNVAMVYIQNNSAGNGWGLSAGMQDNLASNSSYGVYGFNYGTGYGVFGKNYNAGGVGVHGINTSANHYGELGTPDYGAYAQYSDSIYAYLGGSSYGVYARNNTIGTDENCYSYLASSTYGIYGRLDNGDGISDDNYFYFAYDGPYGGYIFQDYDYDGITYGLYVSAYNDSSGTSGAPGSAAIYAYRGSSSNSSGNGYGCFHGRYGVKGYTFYGIEYAFGVGGYRFDDGNNRTGGVIGGSSSGNPPTQWGSLGYRNSAGTHYGVYGSSAYASGGGRARPTPGGLGEGQAAHMGLGIHGDLFGGWIRGNYGGLMVKGGELFSSYTDGIAINNAVSVTLSETGRGDERVASYSVQSMNVDIYDRGVERLDSGSRRVEFSDEFRAMLSDEETPVVTVTPVGSCNGIYLSEIDNDGFTVIENDGGSSNIQFMWIAIGTRRGYENGVEIHPDILSAEFDRKIDRVMFNDSDMENNAQPIWWDGSNLQYSPIPETPQEIKEIEKLNDPAYLEEQAERERLEAEHRQMLELEAQRKPASTSPTGDGKASNAFDNAADSNIDTIE